MPKYGDDFTEDEFVRLRAVALEMGRSGPFDAKDFMVRALESQATNSAGNIDQVLIDLTDLGICTSFGQPGALARSATNSPEPSSGVVDHHDRPACYSTAAMILASCSPHSPRADPGPGLAFSHACISSWSSTYTSAQRVTARVDLRTSSISCCSGTCRSCPYGEA
jgi:hypothetical protein